MKSFCFSFTFLIVLLIGLNNKCYSQQIFNSTDLSQFRISNLSDDDINKYLQELKTNNMTLEQAEKIALLKGLPPGEIQKLPLHYKPSFPGDKIYSNSSF